MTGDSGKLHPEDPAYGTAASANTMKAFRQSRGTAPLIVNLGARRTYNLTASHTTDNVHILNLGAGRTYNLRASHTTDNVQHDFSTIRINPPT